MRSPIADLHGLSPSIKIAAVFADGVMPWPKHFFPKTFGRSLQPISRPTDDRRSAVAHVSMIARP